MFLSGCYTATLNAPKKYDIYIVDAPQNVVLDYVKFMADQSHYDSHKTLVINKGYAEISYTSKLAPEVILQKTQDFFGYGYLFKLNSNVIKVEAASHETL